MKLYRFFLFIYLIILSASLNGQTATPKHEIRAVWLTTIGGLDWPKNYAGNSQTARQQQRELTEILDKLQAAGINMVLLQTRIRATTIYPSQYEPFDACLTGTVGQSPGYDPLQFAIDECHRRGMECHAWVVTIPVGKWNAPGCKRLRERMPDNIIKVGQEGYLNPEKSQTATYLADICEEIISRYDVDGIHLDYIRYPEDWKKQTNASTARKNIDRIVETIHHRVKAQKPWVKTSCSPIGKFKDLTRYSSRGWNAYSRVHQDAQGWLRQGWMDMLLPMMYFKGNNFYPFLLDWKENSHGRHIGAGLGIYLLHPKEGNWTLADIVREMEVSRLQGVGQVYFRSKFFTDNTKGIYDFAKDKFYQHPALVPPLEWETTSQPHQPTDLQVSISPLGKVTLHWKGDAPLYNIYFSKTFPVDTSRGENLLSVRIPSTRFMLPEAYSKRYFFAVTAMDRFGKESQPLQQLEERRPIPGAKMMEHDGKWLRLTADRLPAKDNVFIIETLQGVQVDARRLQNGAVDISRLPRGTYILRSVDKKGNSHRIGFFRK